MASRVLDGKQQNYVQIETPFDKRYLCWFCGEPAGDTFAFPQQANAVLKCPHPPLIINCCTECKAPANKSTSHSIWQCRKDVKRWLITHFHKDLAIGLNWTEQELAEAEFEGGCFEGFARSAWSVFLIAKNRVNYRAWPLVINGIELEEEQEQAEFSFDGVCYPSLNDAIRHFTLSYHLERAFFIEVLSALGVDKFAQAIRFCRLLVNETPKERRLALQQLLADQIIKKSSS